MGPLLYDRVLETSATTGTGTLSLAGAVAGYRSFGTVGNGNTCPYSAFAVNSNGSPTGDWEVGIGTYTAAGTTLSRDRVLSSRNANALVNFGAGTKYVLLDMPAAFLEPDNGICQGRLTLESGVPISSSDQTAKATVYFTPYQGSLVALYNGNCWRRYRFTELSLGLGTLTSGKNYDVFLYDNAGTLALELLAWSTDTARATEVTLQDGVYVKSGATTRRLVGTLRTTATTTTEDSAAKRFLWNVQNRVERFLTAIDTTDQWAYTTNAWRQANGAAANKVEYVCGLLEDQVDVTVVQSMGYLVGTFSSSGVGVDSTTTRSGLVAVGYNNNANAISLSLTAKYQGLPGLGYHFLAWLEQGMGSPAGAVFYGDNGETNLRQSGLYATVRA